MKKYQGPEFTPTEINDEFKKTAWPAIFGNWAIIAKGSVVPQKELFKQWQDQINGLDPIFVEGRAAHVNSEGRELLKAMGLVQVRKVPLRDKIGFTLFAPEPADYDAFASRVEFTEPGIALLTDAAQTATALELPAGAPPALPESF
jgi:hypothetical protein